MNAMQIYDIILIIAGILAFVALADQAYKMIAFKILAEHRQEIIKAYERLKDVPDLRDNETIAMIRVIKGMYDRKVQARVLKQALHTLRAGHVPKKSDVRADVDRMSGSFAAISMANHPFLTYLLLREVTNRKTDMKQQDSRRSGPVARAERVVYLEVQLKSQANERDLIAC